MAASARSARSGRRGRQHLTSTSPRAVVSGTRRSTPSSARAKQVARPRAGERHGHRDVAERSRAGLAERTTRAASLPPGRSRAVEHRPPRPSRDPRPRCAPAARRRCLPSSAERRTVPVAGRFSEKARSGPAPRFAPAVATVSGPLEGARGGPPRAPRPRRRPSPWRRARRGSARGPSAPGSRPPHRRRRLPRRAPSSPRGGRGGERTAGSTRPRRPPGPVEGPGPRRPSRDDLERRAGDRNQAGRWSGNSMVASR
jgi:hypothetical protein